MRTLNLILFILFSISLSAQKYRKYADELITKYRELAADTCRCQSTEEWNRRKEFLYSKVDSAKNYIDAMYALRYFTPMINDLHFICPDNYYYNRRDFYKKTDTIFPALVKTTDKLTVKKDFYGKLPEGAVLLEINGYKAEDIAKTYKYSVSMEYTDYTGETDFHSWMAFANFLFMEKIKAPFHIQYSFNNTIHNVTITGMERKILDKQEANFRKSQKKEPKEKIMEYYQYNQNIGVLRISTFNGNFNKNLSAVFEKIKQNQAALVIDLRGNSGGEATNAVRLMGYLTDSIICYDGVYKYSEKSRKNLLWRYSITNNDLADSLKNQFKELSYGDFFESNPIGMCTGKEKYKYNNPLYILIDESTNSASILFCGYFIKMNRGKIAGLQPRGYMRVGGGYTTRIDFEIGLETPYSYYPSLECKPLIPNYIIEEKGNEGLDKLVEIINKEMNW